MKSRKSEKRVRFRCKSDTEQCRFRFVVELCFPIVYFVLLRNGQVTLNAALRVEEFDFGPGFNETICDLQLRFELPGGNTFLLDGQKLR